jgi:hypothetical protein
MMTLEIGRRYRFAWEGGHVDGDVVGIDGNQDSPGPAGVSVLIDRPELAKAAGVRGFRTQLFLGSYLTATPIPDPAVALAGALVADALEMAVSGYGYEALLETVRSIIAAIRPPGGARWRQAE